MCARCATDVENVDDDGYVAQACGGNDCDDSNPAINPGASELCDVLGVDEDCDADTWGDDEDSDGEFAIGCCYQPPDGTLACGGDCDDGDDAIHPGAVERCNALDDDCDGSIDEDFDCVQSLVSTGPNGCGRDGTRSCSEACAWLDDDFYRAESAGSCDYCDDSGVGLGEEIPFATEMLSATTSAGWIEHGDARTTSVTTIVDGASERGAVYTTTGRLGYGLTYITAEVRTTARRSVACTPICGLPLDGDWSLVLLPEAATVFLDPTRADALPDEAGVAARWSFSSLCGTGCLTAADNLQLRPLPPTAPIFAGGSPPSGHQDGPVGTMVTQRLTLELTPDDPRTRAVDETAITLVMPLGVSAGCANDAGPACGMTLRPGDRLVAGIVAGSTSNNDIAVTQPAITTTTNAACAAP